jgi:hypothetical protein
MKITGPFTATALIASSIIGLTVVAPPANATPAHTVTLTAATPFTGGGCGRIWMRSCRRP